jgi:hypothetical protein
LNAGLATPCNLISDRPRFRSTEQPDPALAVGLADDRGPPVHEVTLAARGMQPAMPHRTQRLTPLPPAKRIEGVTVEWDEMHFDVRLLQRVPCAFLPLARVARLRPSRFRLTVPQSCSQTRACRGCVRFARLDPQRCQRPCFF